MRFDNRYNVYSCDDGYHIIYDDMDETMMVKTKNQDLAESICHALNVIPDFDVEDVYYN